MSKTESTLSKVIKLNDRESQIINSNCSKILNAYWLKNWCEVQIAMQLQIRVATLRNFIQKITIDLPNYLETQGAKTALEIKQLLMLNPQINIEPALHWSVKNKIIHQRGDCYYRSLPKT